MKTATKLYLAGCTTLAPLGTALAAEGAREDASGLFVWAFLGLCALIVAAQVIPAILMTIGAAKGVAEGIRERGREAAKSEVPAR